MTTFTWVNDTVKGFIVGRLLRNVEDVTFIQYINVMDFFDIHLVYDYSDNYEVYVDEDGVTIIQICADKWNNYSDSEKVSLIAYILDKHASHLGIKEGELHEVI